MNIKNHIKVYNTLYPFLQNSDLRRIFHFTVTMLDEVVKADEKGANQLNDLLAKLITIAENILTWSFISLHLPKRLMSVFEQDQNPSLRPGQHWRETFMDSSILQLFFKVSHIKERDR